MYRPYLTEAGLTMTQAIIYETLLKNGPLPAGKISKKTALVEGGVLVKRGLVYKDLEELIKAGLVAKTENPNQVAIFSITHPLKIKDLLEKKMRRTQDVALTMEGILPSLISDFNLVSGQPGIRFAEGDKGIEEILGDSLNTKTEICTFADWDSVQKHMSEINKRYVQKRNQKGLSKRVIMLDTPATVEYMKNYYQDITHVRFINHELYPFTSLTEIYDNTVSYVSLDDQRKIGVIIKNKSIYEMQLSLFNFIWQHAREVKR